MNVRFVVNIFQEKEYDKHKKIHKEQVEQIEYREEAVVLEEDESSSEEEVEEEESEEEFSTIDNNWDKIFG